MKWKTVGSAGSREDLEQMINNYYFSSNYVIGDELEKKNHYEVKNTKTGKVVSYCARLFRKRWQYGFYE